ncbi:MAG: hypothetical protein Tsb0021_15890 [Chlamydiales bacterium]
MAENPNPASQAQNIPSSGDTQAPGSTGPSGTPGTPMTVPNTMEELRQQAPEVFKAMMDGLAQNLINRMRRHAARMKDLIRESLRGKQ